MHALLLYALLAMGQMNTAIQDKPGIRLPPSRPVIDATMGGKTVEVVNVQEIVRLPATPPRLNADGSTWNVDVKNMGPNVITLSDGKQFTTQINLGQTLHIFSFDAKYQVRR